MAAERYLMKNISERGRVWSLVVTLLLVLAAVGVPGAQSKPDLALKAAMDKEVVDGDLKGAIEMYRKLAGDNDRVVAAKALLAMGQCYEKLGSSEAGKAYERLLSQFGDQPATVAVARARLAKLRPVNSTATQATLMWSGPELHLTTSITADDRHVFYMDRASGDVAVVDPSDGSRRRLTHTGTWFTPFGSMAWAHNFTASLDGRWIAFVWGGVSGSRALHVARVDGSGVHLLYGDDTVTSVRPYEWSRDGRSILTAVWKRGRPTTLNLISSVDGAVGFSMDCAVVPQRATLSPDSRYLAYDSTDGSLDGQTDILIVSTADGHQVAAMRSPGRDVAPVWSADGRDIFFLSNRTVTGSLWAQPMADGRPTGGPRLAKQDMTRAWPIGIDRDGSLEYVIINNAADVFIADFDDKTGRVVGQPVNVAQSSVGTNSSVAWSPDSQRLAFVHGQVYDSNTLFASGSTDALRLHAIDTGVERSLVSELRYVSLPHWSPDGRTIVAYGSGSERENGLYAIDATTGAVAPVKGSTGISNFNFKWELGPDGQSIIHKPGKGPALLRSLATGADRVISGPADDNATLSPDGRSLAYTLTDTTTGVVQLIVSSVADLSTRVLARLQLPELIDGIAWTPHGDLIVARGGYMTDRWVISHVAVATGEMTPVGITTHDVRMIQVSPDGRHLAYYILARKGEIWKLSNPGALGK